MSIVIPRREVWTSQPQQVSNIDGGNSLSRGLLASVNEANRTLRGNFPTQLGGAPAVGTSGRCLSFTGTRQQFAVDTYLASGCCTSAGCSVAVLFDIRTLTNYGGLISLQDTTTSYAAFEIRVGNGSSDSRICLVRAGTTGYATSSTGADRLVAGQTGVVLVVIFPNDLIGSIATVYVNGISYSVNMGGLGVQVAVPTTNGLVLGGRSPDTVTKLDGNVYGAHIWGRALTNAEALAVSNNFWQIFAP